MTPEQQAADLRQKLDQYLSAMRASDPARARDVAFDMLSGLNALYNAAYSAAAQQARRDGRIG
jgi:hypothetical protein